MTLIICVLLVATTLISVSFWALYTRYVTEEKQTSMRKTADSVVTLTKAYSSYYLRDVEYRTNLAVAAAASGSDIVICTEEGMVCICANDIQNCAHLGHSLGRTTAEKVFTSGAPNPVSLIHIIGEPTDRFALLKDLCVAIERHVEAIANPEKREEIVEMYKSILWRSDGMHKYAIPGGETFMAAIEDISPAGYLFLRDDKGEIRKFAFKEVQYIL